LKASLEKGPMARWITGSNDVAPIIELATRTSAKLRIRK
jgi:hypothetical protein